MKTALPGSLGWELSLDRSDLRSHAWYHGPLLQSTAEVMLRRDGDFLVSETMEEPIRYILTCRCSFRSLHIEINQVAINPDVTSDIFEYWLEDERFGSIPDLITSYVGAERPVCSKSGARILQPVNRRSPIGRIARNYVSRRSADWSNAKPLGDDRLKGTSSPADWSMTLPVSMRKNRVRFNTGKDAYSSAPGRSEPATGHATMRRGLPAGLQTIEEQMRSLGIEKQAHIEAAPAGQNNDDTIIPLYEEIPESHVAKYGRQPAFNLVQPELRQPSANHNRFPTTPVENQQQSLGYPADRRQDRQHIPTTDTSDTLKRQGGLQRTWTGPRGAMKSSPLYQTLANKRRSLTRSFSHMFDKSRKGELNEETENSAIQSPTRTQEAKFEQEQCSILLKSADQQQSGQGNAATPQRSFNMDAGVRTIDQSTSSVRKTNLGDIRRQHSTAGTSNPSSVSTLPRPSRVAPQEPSRQRTELFVQPKVAEPSAASRSPSSQPLTLESIMVPSFFSIKHFESPFLPASAVKPMDRDAIRAATSALLRASPGDLASHLTLCDLDMMHAGTSKKPAANPRMTGAALAFLPQGKNLRNDIIERFHWLRLFVAMTLLLTGDKQSRTSLLHLWITTATEARNIGNMMGFAGIVAGLSMPQILRLKSLWKDLRQQFTTSAMDFDVRHRPTLQQMETGANSNPPHTCVPHLFPVASLLGRADHTATWWPDRVIRVLSGAREMATQATRYGDRGRAALKEVRKQTQLESLFRSELHMRLMLGQRACDSSREERAKQINTVLEIFSVLSREVERGTD